MSEAGLDFCCVGCRAVFALLTENGLGQFYDLAPNPGMRVGQSAATSSWGFLDDPSVQRRLLDFSDERQARVTLDVPAIHCVACVWLLENLYRLGPGIGESRVHFGRREVSIAFEPARVKLSEIAVLLDSLGYRPELRLSELDRAGNRPVPGWRQRHWLQAGVAGFGFGNVMLLSLPAYLGLDSLSGPWFKVLAGWLSLVLALPVLLFSAADYWRAAWLCVRQRLVTLDLPIAIGLAAIYGQSVYEVATGRGEGYCDSLTGLIFFLICGRLFQRKTFDRLAFDRDYKGFFPLAVLRKTPTDEESVAISELAVGDRLLIRHGELVPADARLIGGDALIDYSFVTGESEPVPRRAGEHLYAGGRQVSGAIEVETVRPVSESYLTSLWNNEAFRKPRDDERQTLTNRYSRRFTLIVMSIALTAAVFWLAADGRVAMKAFTSVLIVACPCALALVAPLTLGTAQRWLADHGVFLRNAQIIERLSAVNTIVLDKTGTLTAPGPGGAAWSGAPLTELEQSCLRSLAGYSSHPLAVRITEMLRPFNAGPVGAFSERAGGGLQGRIAGMEIRMGSMPWLREGGTLRGGPEMERAASGETASCVHVAIDNEYRGRFVLQGALRPEVDVLIGRLRGSYSLVLLSGDQPREMERFQALLGSKARLEFNQSPFDKLNVIRELQTVGGGARNVMMVGDGLNDAGALRQADVGVAVVEKVGSFSPASDVIVDAAQLARLAEVLSFSRRAAQVVKAGFMVSGLYNVVGISIAAAGLLSPLVCAVLMPLSSATVVLFAVGATRRLALRSFALGKSHRSGRDWAPVGPMECSPVLAEKGNLS